MSKRGSRRLASVYDAVAERVGYQGFIDSGKARTQGDDESDNEAQSRRGSGHRGNPVTPEEVLFRGTKAPERYEENDIYAADRELRSDQQLPDSDLLKAIHTYASDYYLRATDDGGKCDFQSMDGTALLACGILLEEACKDVLGKTGDLVFTEPAFSDSDTSTGRADSDGSETAHANKRRKLSDSASSSEVSSQSVSESFESEDSG